ncbi:hypothetical protein P9250_11680 [Caballeronia sp. LP006]|nr:hypothetical protein [Caballeronia sp. LP006]
MRLPGRWHAVGSVRGVAICECDSSQWLRQKTQDRARSFQAIYGRRLPTSRLTRRLLAQKRQSLHCRSQKKHEREIDWIHKNKGLRGLQRFVRSINILNVLVS